MASVFIEIASSALGAIAGILALAFLIVTVRSLINGQPAYEANRAISQPNIWLAFKGDMVKGSDTAEGRTNHGLAIELKSGKILPQRRLSSDAINDVIARHP